jgi:type II secretory pathway pseudopilin PulG
VNQRGSTLVELMVAAAIAAFLAALFAFSFGARPLATRSATAQVDAALGAAEALASTSGSGATIVFAPAQPGFSLTIYAGRPSGAGLLRPFGLAPMNARAGIVESMLGPPPFTVFLDGAGHASAMKGTVTPSTPPLANDPGCPPGESAVTLTLSDPRTSVIRTLPCLSESGQ